MAHPSNPDTVRIFDTTLRDGEQSPGASLTSAEKLEIARQLSRLGVDVIEAGFPAASPDDHEAVWRIAAEVSTPEGPIVAGLARTHQGDIESAWRSVWDAAKPRIHCFLATSDRHHVVFGLRSRTDRSRRFSRRPMSRATARPVQSVPS